VRLTLVISSLGCGGAERVMASLANHWAAAGHAVTLLTWDDGREPPFYKLNEGVAWKPLGIKGASRGLFDAARAFARRRVRLRAALQESTPDVILSFIEDVNVLTVAAGRGVAPVVVSERTNPEAYPTERIWRLLRAWAYGRADRLVTQTERAKAFFPPRVRTKTTVIPNAVAPWRAPASAGNTLARPHLLSVGRLEHYKGYDLLIEAFARLKDKHPLWTLTVLGDGPQRKNLTELCAARGVASRVALAGRVDEPAVYLAQADLYVQPSRLEGFPNALCEAMAAGLPAVATDCSGGPAEIVRPGVDGLLVKSGSVDALAEGLDRLMSNADERRRLAGNAAEISKRFPEEKIFQMWDAVLAAARGIS